MHATRKTEEVHYEQFFFLGKHLAEKYQKPVARIFTAPVTNEKLMREADSFDYVKGRSPVVYISLGTVVKGGVSFFQNCLEAFRDEDMDVIISVGENFDCRKLRNIPSNIHIYNSVPQLEVLKMTDVFVTHGGMNSVSESL